MRVGERGGKSRRDGAGKEEDVEGERRKGGREGRKEERIGGEQRKGGRRGGKTGKVDEET